VTESVDDVARWASTEYGAGCVSAERNQSLAMIVATSTANKKQTPIFIVYYAICGQKQVLVSGFEHAKQNADFPVVSNSNWCARARSSFRS